MAGSQTGKGAVELCRRERPDLISLNLISLDIIFQFVLQRPGSFSIVSQANMESFP